MKATDSLIAFGSLPSVHSKIVKGRARGATPGRAGILSLSAIEPSFRRLRVHEGLAAHHGIIQTKEFVLG